MYLNIGQRVIAKQGADINPDYQGLVGTIVAHDGSRYYVRFDSPPDTPHRREYPGGGHGGTWHGQYLQVVQNLCAGCDALVLGMENDYLCSKCRKLAPID